MADKLEKEIEKLKEEVKLLRERRIHQTMITAGTIKRRHLEDKITVFGLAADRPTNDTTGISVWFATDTNVLSLWNGTAFLS